MTKPSCDRREQDLSDQMEVFRQAIMRLGLTRTLGSLTMHDVRELVKAPYDACSANFAVAFAEITAKAVALSAKLEAIDAKQRATQAQADSLLRRIREIEGDDRASL